MANTHGFEVIIQASKNVVVKALKGAWKSATCTIDPGEEGRIPEFLDTIIPAGGLTVGGYTIIDGQVQIPQAELDAAFAPDINGVELILGLKTQLHISKPDIIPSAQLLSFHSVVHAKAPAGTLPESLNVGILLAGLQRANVWAILDQGHPLDARLLELLTDYVHQAYVKNEIPHLIPELNVSFVAGKCSTNTQIFDNGANMARQILVSFPNPATLQISIPIYLRMYGFNPSSLPVVGEIASPMGIETRIIINAPFVKQPDKYIANFGAVTAADITVGPIAGAGSDIAGNPNEAINYASNKVKMAAIDLDALLSNQLKLKGVKFATDLGNRSIDIPSIAEIETLIADQFFAELKARKNIGLWTPAASDAAFHVDSVDVKVISDTLNIALNNTGTGDLNAITNFIPVNMEFSIAMNKESLDAKIQRSIEENGFNKFPKRFVEDGKDVDLHSLSVSVIDFSIRLEGTVTVIDAVADSIDVDASFRTDVGLHWEPNGSLNIDDVQALKHHEIGSSDVDVDEGIAFWIVAIILAIVSFGIGGVFIGIISLIVILIVKSIVENIGTGALVDGVSGAINGITAWPPKLSRIGRVKAVFFDPVDISSTGLVLSGVFEVISSCEIVEVVPATTAGAYSVNAAQSLQLTALKTYFSASYFWDPGDGTGIQPLQIVNHTYDNSAVYVAKHGVKVTVPGGAKSRHFALVRVKNVPPTVNAGTDITVNEGELVNLEAHFEDVEYLDTHTSIWNFGDDQPVKIGAITETNNKPKAIGVSKVEHAWCDNGEYYVSVQIIDQDGGIGIATKKVTVLNVVPVVITPIKMYAYPCSPITLTGNFTDPGWCDTHTATWRFGDCSMTKMAIVKETNEAPAAKGTAIASNIYKKCGTYYSECTVTDDDGGIGKANTIVEVIVLKNHDFNDGFTYDPLGKIANFWTPFISSYNDNLSYAASAGKATNAASGIAGREIFFCEKCLVFDGLSAQRIKIPYRSFTGIYQTFGANPEWEYQVGFLYQLNGSSGMVKIGLDPMGLTDPTSADIVWSEGNDQNQWSHLLQRVIAKADKLTVFIGIVNTADTMADGCFDCVELIAMQNTLCPDQRQPVPPKSVCTDFREVNREQQLPSAWTVKGLTFITADNSPNRIISFPQAYIPGLEIRKGMIIEFKDPAESLSFEFGYRNELYVVIVLSDVAGKVLLKDEQDLKNGKTTIQMSASNIHRAQLYVRGEGALTNICYK